MTRLPGLDASTGSLGQGMSVAVGMALGAKLRGLDFQTWVMLGDGEMQEGQVWESVALAAKYGLGNLTVVVDANGMQQYGWPLEPDEAHRGDRRDPFGAAVPRAVLEGFGWRVLEIDGHDFGEILGACETALAASRSGVPTAILARTVKGRGFSFTEGASAWHARAATADDVAAARLELGETAP
jgi:transketolase